MSATVALPEDRRCPSRRPAPCKDCGGPKEAGLGRGALFCAACQARRDAAAPMCARCGERPPMAKNRVCTVCRAPRANPCPGCGAVKAGRGHRYCAECQAIRSEAAAIRRRALRASRERKPCRGCNRPKGPGRRQYCDRCQREREAAKGVRVCGRCQQERQIPPHHKLCDVCRAAAAEAKRAYKAAWQRERAELIKRGEWVPDPARAKSRPLPELPRTLPAAPLVALFDRLAAQADVGGMRGVCARARVGDRRLRDWRVEGARVHFSVAERILLELEVGWEDVWPDHVELHRALAA